MLFTCIEKKKRYNFTIPRFFRQIWYTFVSSSPSATRGEDAVVYVTNLWSLGENYFWTFGPKIVTIDKSYIETKPADSTNSTKTTHKMTLIYQTEKTAIYKYKKSFFNIISGSIQISNLNELDPREFHRCGDTKMILYLRIYMSAITDSIGLLCAY